MNTKNNSRRRETIRKIETVFLDCLQTTELSKIKVCEICKRADINRSTFYANFADIPELADRIRTRLAEEVNRLFEADMQGQGLDTDFLRLFRHIEENQALYHFYFKLGYDRSEDLKLHELWQDAHNIDPAALPYHLAFFMHGFNAIVKLWLDGGCRETPEQMTEILSHEYCGRLLPPLQQTQ